MTLRAVDHVQLAMPAGAEEQARAFWVGVMELTEVPKPPPLLARGGCWFAHGNVAVHCGVEPDFRPARKAHPAFVVEDLDAALARCEAAGSEVKPAEDLYGRRRAHVSDPFGNRLELIEPPPG